MKINKNLIKKNLNDIENNFKNLDDEYYLELIQKAALLIVKSIKKKNKIIFCGNGGSASDGEHLCAELAGRYLKNRKAYPAIALTGNSSLITALGNDCGFENIFIEQLKILFNPGDVLLVISASGNSKNIINACDWVNSNSGKTIGWLGFDGGNLLKKVSCAILVETPKGEYAPVEDVHLIFNHILVSWMHIYLAKPD